MKILIIDTALGACTVAVLDDEMALASRSEFMAKGHQERLGGMVRDVIAGARGGFESLDRIGVTVGPGSFTGLRVGLAFAQGLGAALGRPVVGVGTLAALARSTDVAGRTFAAIDARRGQVYGQAFEDGRPLGPAEALTIEQANDQVRKLAAHRVVGSGAALLADAAPEARLEGLAAPTIRGLADLVLAADPADSPALPLYLRAPDATPPTRLPGQARAARVVDA